MEPDNYLPIHQNSNQYIPKKLRRQLQQSLKTSSKTRDFVVEISVYQSLLHKIGALTENELKKTILAALVPKPRVNLTRFHGVFAPNSKHRAMVTPARRGKDSKVKAIDDSQDRTPDERQASMNWAQRLKRVFDIGAIKPS